MKNTVSIILKLASDLRKSGYSKQADELEFKYLVLKKAEIQHYSVIKEIGQDLIDMAHPEGSHRLVGVEGDSVFETISDQKEKIEKIVKKEPSGKFSAKQIVSLIKSAGKLSRMERLTEAVKVLIEKIKKSEEAVSDLDSVRRGGAASERATDVTRFKTKLKELGDAAKLAESAVTKVREEIQKLGVRAEDLKKIEEYAEKIKSYQKELSSAESGVSEIIATPGGVAKLERLSEAGDSVAQEKLERMAELEASARRLRDMITQNTEELDSFVKGIKLPLTGLQWGGVIGGIASGVTSGLQAILAAIEDKELKLTEGGALSISTLRTKAKEMAASLRGKWGISHPFVDALDSLSAFLDKKEFNNIQDFKNLTKEQRADLIKKLEEILTSLAESAFTYNWRTVALIVPISNVIIDYNDAESIKSNAKQIGDEVNTIKKTLQAIDENVQRAQEILSSGPSSTAVPAANTRGQ